MLVSSFNMSSVPVNDYGDDNNDGIQRKSQGRGTSACVIFFLPGVSHTAHCEVLGGYRQEL